MKAVGIDIGSSSIKIAEAESSGRSTYLTAIWEIPLNTDKGHDQTLEVIEKLRTFTNEYMAKLSSASDVKWILAIPQKSVSTRFKQFPFADRNKIIKSLPFELEEEVPFNPMETVFDARILQTRQNGAEVLAVACPHSAIENAIQRAKDGGFDAAVIAPEGLSLSNILVPWWIPPLASSASPLTAEETFPGKNTGRVLLQIGHRQTNFIAFKDDLPISIRSMSWGGHDIAMALAETFKIPYLEALKVLKTKSFLLLNTDGASRDQMAMHRAIADSAEPFLRDLRTTLLDLKAAFDVDIQNIDLTGGTSQIQNLGPWLTQALEVKTNTLNYYNILQSIGHTQLRIDQSSEAEAIAASAIGLALEGLRKARNPSINLRKGIYAQQNESLKHVWEAWGVTAQLALVIFVFLTVYASMRESSSMSLVDESDTLLSQAAQQVAGLRGSAATPDKIQLFLDKEQREIKNRKALSELNEYVSAMDLIAKMAEKFPVVLPPREGRGLEVDHIMLSNDDLTVQGRVFGQDLIAVIEKELSAIARQGTVKKSTPNNIRKGALGTPFAFMMKIDRKPEH